MLQSNQFSVLLSFFILRTDRATRLHDRDSRRILWRASSVITVMLRLSRTTRASTTNAGLPGSVKASTAPRKMQIIDHENPSYPCDYSEAKLVV